MRAAFAVAILIASLVSPAHAQDDYRAPRTSLGQPDLQGTWTNETTTRFERPPEMAGRLVMTPEETTAADRGSEFRPAMRVNGQPRTSLITSPSDGRVPAMKPGASPDPRDYTLKPGEKVTDGPELQPIDDRCILPIFNNAGPVMLPLPGNSNYQIVQTTDHVVILVEMIHDARIVRLNSTHRTDGLRPYLGDSIGWWEGDTLVVETTNFPAGQMFRGSWINLKITERFTRSGDKRLHYGFTVEDATKWSASWGGEYEFRPAHGPIGEYACREGEISLPSMLRAARIAEAAEAAKTAN
ncbi:MAG: hypothetical protein B7Y90_05815 [Alphaproteobacteria bacterium 32-64-14]|nr:MAG: hypothetical protein B7Y90_05815 [Alphaproteobacteria bacterium 32-64-14]